MHCSKNMLSGVRVYYLNCAESGVGDVLAVGWCCWAVVHVLLKTRALIVLVLPVLWSTFFIISGPQIWGDIGDMAGYSRIKRGIQRDKAGYSRIWRIQRDTAGYSGIQRDTAGYSGV